MLEAPYAPWRMRVSTERYRQIAVASLVALFLVIVAGAAVRLSNSGLGCDDRQ